MRRRSVALALTIVSLAYACDGIYRITVETPYCPVSDSAKARADSIPLPCILDTTR